MSGSSGGSFGRRVSTEEPNCEKIQLKTNLASPDPEVLDDISEGEVLQITLAGVTGPIHAVTSGGEVAGSVLVSNPARIISCINEGYLFQARVILKDGGDCQVIIYCVGKDD